MAEDEIKDLLTEINNKLNTAFSSVRFSLKTVSDYVYCDLIFKYPEIELEYIHSVDCRVDILVAIFGVDQKRKEILFLELFLRNLKHHNVTGYMSLDVFKEKAEKEQRLIHWKKMKHEKTNSLDEGRI